MGVSVAVVNRFGSVLTYYLLSLSTFVDLVAVFVVLFGTIGTIDLEDFF